MDQAAELVLTSPIVPQRLPRAGSALDNPATIVATSTAHNGSGHCYMSLCADGYEIAVVDTACPGQTLCVISPDPSTWNVQQQPEADSNGEGRSSSMNNHAVSAVAWTLAFPDTASGLVEQDGRRAGRPCPAARHQCHGPPAAVGYGRKTPACADRQVHVTQSSSHDDGLARFQLALAIAGRVHVYIQADGREGSINPCSGRRSRSMQRVRLQLASSAGGGIQSPLVRAL
jgi:hypothetical protein